MEKREIRFDGWTVNFDSGEISRDGQYPSAAGPAAADPRGTGQPARRGGHPRTAHRPALAQGRGGIRHRAQQRDAQAPHRPRRRRRHPPLHRDAAPQGLSVHRAGIEDRRPHRRHSDPARAVFAHVVRDRRGLGRRASDRRAPSNAWPWGSAASSPRWCWRWWPGTCRAGFSRSMPWSKRCRPSWCCRWST